MQKKLYESGKSLSSEQRFLLEQLPLEQVNNKDRAWNTVYNDAKDFYLKNHHLQVSSSYKGASAIVLSDWMSRQRRARKDNKLTEEQIQKLNEIHFVWEISDCN